MIPAEAWHLWTFVADEMAERGWTKHDLAARMGGNVEVDYLTLEFLEHGQYEPALVVGQETADALSRAFGVSAEFFINLDRAWHEWIKAHPLTGQELPNGD